MADLVQLRIKTPMVSSQSDRSEAEAIADMKVAYDRSWKEIKDVANIHNVPLALGFSIAVVENGGLTGQSQDKLSYGAMQTNAATLDGVIKFAFKEDMPFNQFFYIYYKCTSAFKLKANVVLPKLANLWDESNLKLRNRPISDLMTYKGKDSILTDSNYNKITNKYNQLMMQDKYFGLHIGMMYLYQLISQSIITMDGKDYIRVDWVINGYNGGYYKKGNPWINESSAKYTPDEYLTLPTELVAPVTKKYVKRICGVGGYLELIKLRKFTF